MSLTKVTYAMIQGAPISILDFGAVGDGVTDDTLSFVAMAAYVNSQGANINVVFPPGNYVFSPQNHYSSNYAWRAAVEMVDVSNITISGYGATITQDIPGSWTVNDPANFYNDEGAIQFRSTGDSTCNNIIVQGLNVVMTKLAYSAGFGDGTSFGIALRGVKNYRIVDCNVTGASTDGIYCGATYSDTYGGSYGIIENCQVTTSNRNGLSIVQNSYVQVIGGSYTYSSGGSFQAGIDLEPNGVKTQSNITISGVYVANNTNRGIATLRSSDVNIQSCNFYQNSKEVDIQSGSSFINVIGNTFNCNSIGVEATGTTVTDVKIENNNFYAPSAMTYFIRVAFSGSSGFTNFSIKNNSLKGQSGIYVGAVTGYCDVIGNDHFANIPAGGVAGTNIFTWSSSSTVLKLTDNTITIDPTITWAGAQYKFAPLYGWAERNKFTSHSAAVCIFYSRTVAATIECGQNEWSQYFYYDESLSNNAFRIFGKGCGVSYQGDGGPINTNGVNGARVVIGGVNRTTNVNARDNQVGDVTYVWEATSGNPLAYRCTVAGVPGSSAGTWVGLWNKS